MPRSPARVGMQVALRREAGRARRALETAKGPNSMSTTGQIQLGLTEVYAPGTSEVIGYAYTEAKGAGQLQRWLLYRRPGKALAVRRPSPEAHMTARTLDEWRLEVAKHWQPG